MTNAQPRTVQRGVAAFALAFLWCLTLAPAALAQPLQGAVEGLIFDAKLHGADIGVLILDASTGETLATLRETEAFIPASNMKILTSGAALAVLGPGFAFETRLELAGDSLVIRGSGDPGLADPELLDFMGLSIGDFLDGWVNDIVAHAPEGVSEIVLDTDIFDDEYVNEEWPADQLNRWYCAQVSGLSFHSNVVSVFVSPTKPGLAPSVRVEPRASWLPIENRARTVRNGRNTVWVARPEQNNTMTLFGSVRRPSEQPIEVAVHDMPMILGGLLADRLAGRGLERPAVRRATPTELFEDARAITVVRTPMQTILERCNTDSHNLYAESLLKRMAHDLTGQPGSWTTGAAILRMVVEQMIGPRYAADLVASDGSGMSRANRVTPRLVVRWLEALAQTHDLADPFRESLPEAGETGTLRKRFRGVALQSEVRAKTGYLNRVSAMSGYVIHPVTGKRLTFSILVNNFPNSVPLGTVLRFQEEVVKIMDDHLAGQLAEAPTTDAP